MASPSDDRPQPVSPSLDAILDQFSQYQRRLYLYVLGLVGSPADAEEVLQETNIIVWRKCEQFQPGTDFRAWVFRIALFEARKLHERRRKRGVGLSEDLLEQLATTYERQEDLLETRRERLAGCLDKLKPGDRELVRDVYGRGVEVPTLSKSRLRRIDSVRA